MKLNYPMEAYASLILFLTPIISCLTFLYWKDFAVRDIPLIILIFLIISSFSTVIAAVIIQGLIHRKFFSINNFNGHSIYSIAWRAGILGCVFVFGIFLSFDFNRPSMRPFGYYLCILTFFHWSEYFTTAVTSRETLRLDSFLLNHSVEYWAAAFLSWMEFAIEYYFCSRIKSITLITWIGFGLCVVGETFRKLAMFTAGRSFTHLIQYQKRSHHQLVTHGIYSLFRHPSYVGWFWWSIGTQVTLCNPVCFIIYAIISWRFFSDRIYHEEITLINFFGEQYVDYQKRVPTGLPGITGFVG